MPTIQQAQQILKHKFGYDNFRLEQENVIKSLENNSLVAVYGPPGTGKSQTIVNLVSHLIANGKT